MKALARSRLIGVAGAALLWGSVVQGSRSVSADQVTSDDIRRRGPAVTLTVLDSATPRVFVQTARHELSIQNRDGTGVTLLYRGSDQSQIRWARQSPAGGLVAVEELLAGEDRPGKRRVRLVGDPGGAVLRTIPDVVEFVWSPDGQSVAYTTGTYEYLEPICSLSQCLTGPLRSRGSFTTHRPTPGGSSPARV